MTIQAATTVSPVEFAFWLLVVTSIFDTTKAAVKCHDCSSWNPYCREQVDEPFESAVAVVDCDKTSTCFLKKDESGVINRGCADWWMESQVDMSYTGCQTQHVPWLGEMTWCFCKQDYCNGGSMDMLASHEYPEPQSFPDAVDWGDNSDWDEEWTDSENNVDDQSSAQQTEGEEGEEEEEEEEKEGEEGEEEEEKEEKEGEEEKGDDKWGDPGRKWNQVKSKGKGKGKSKGKGKGKGKTFDDVNPEYLGHKKKKKSDPKYQLWFWHADSDRPLWTQDPKADKGQKEGWRAPEWVEARDGNGWDFPVTGKVHQHTAENAKDYHYYGDTDNNRNDDDVDNIAAAASKEESTSSSSSTEAWNWGQGWGHIQPWWMREDEDKSTEKPNRWTPHPTRRVQQQDDGYLQVSGKWAQNTLHGGDDSNTYDDTSTYDDTNSYDDTSSYDDDIDNASLEVQQSDFFCWDCYSESPLCRERVQTQKATYLGKTSCTNTLKCFVRNDGGVVYRGCADGWTSSIIDTDYVGCRLQSMWGRDVEWCFCTASLCNGDSMASIQHKYSAHLQPFRATTMTMSANTTQTMAPVESVTLVKSAAASRDKTTPRRLQKRSTLARVHDSSNVTTDFHIVSQSELTSPLSTVEDSTESSHSVNWQTTETKTDVTVKDSPVVTAHRNETKQTSDDPLHKDKNYKALAG